MSREVSYQEAQGGTRYWNSKQLQRAAVTERRRDLKTESTLVRRSTLGWEGAETIVSITRASWSSTFSLPEVSSR